MLTLTSFPLHHQTVQLVVPEPYFASELYQAVKDNYHEMKKWFPWVENTTTVNDTARFLQMAKENLITSPNASYVIMCDDAAVGMIDLHNFNAATHNIEIGYWLSRTYQGQGIVTNAVKALIGAVQAELNLHKVSIVANVQNVASKAVAQRLGFIHEATLIDFLYSNGQYHNADVYYKIVDK